MEAVGTVLSSSGNCTLGLAAAEAEIFPCPVTSAAARRELLHSSYPAACSSWDLIFSLAA